VIQIIEDPKKEALDVFEQIKFILEPDYMINHSIIGEIVLKKGELDCIISVKKVKKFIIVPYKSEKVICDLVYRFPDLCLVTNDTKSVMPIAKKLEDGGYNVTIRVMEDWRKR